MTEGEEVSLTNTEPNKVFPDFIPNHVFWLLTVVC